MKTIVAPEISSPTPVVPAGTAVPPLARPGVITLPLVLLCLGHMAVDLYSSAISTLQPVLVGHFGFSLAQAGWLGGAFMFASSITQLGFGLLSDRWHPRMFGVLGLLMAGLFLTSFGLARGFYSLLFFIVLGGIGVAAFHPQSTTHAWTLSTHRRGLVMALFFTSGTLGLAMGPTYFSAVVERFGLERLSIAIVPALLVGALLFWQLPAPRHGVSGGKIDTAAFRRQWKPLLLHYMLVVLRSVVQVGMAQFMTLYLYHERGFTLKQASLGLTVFFFAAAAGSFLGGGLADRIGGKPVILMSMIGSTPFLWLFLHSSGWASMLCLFVGGTMLLFTIPVNVVMAQDLLPSQAGTVTSIMMGFAWGMAGITAVPAIGWYADRLGIAAAFEVLALLPLAGFLLALKLPAAAPSVEGNAV